MSSHTRTPSRSAPGRIGSVVLLAVALVTLLVAGSQLRHIHESDTLGLYNEQHVTQGLAALSQANKAGVAVVRSTRLAGGLVLRNNEVDDDKMGFVASLDHNPQKARVLLRLALLKPRTNDDLQRLFNEY